MSNAVTISPAIKFFFKTLERRSDALKNAQYMAQQRYKEVPIDEVEHFFRAIKGQNIFINTVGVNGKRESTILAKAIFNLNKVIRLYYSVSYDDQQSGFIRIRTDVDAQTIVVERIHGIRPQPELLYHSADQCHIIRFMTRWMLRRIDWDKTKLDNLELYKRFVEVQREETEAMIQAQIEEEMLAKMETLH